MRIVTEKRIMEYASRHPNARSSLQNFVEKIKYSHFNNFEELRRVFPSADQVIVGSGRRTIVFNIQGNRHRLVAACHYNTGLVFILKIMTHAEYNKNKWKEVL